MLVSEMVADYLISRTSAGLQEETISQYRRLLTDWLDWRVNRSDKIADLQLREIRDFVRFQANRIGASGRSLSAHTLYGYYRCLRGLWRWAASQVDEADNPLINDRQASMIAIARPELRRLPQRNPGGISKATLEQLLAALDEPTEVSLRDRTIILMLYESGTRIHELCQLQDETTDLSDRSGLIVGKGKKALQIQERIFWGKRTGEALDRYLAIRRGTTGGPLFRGVTWKNDGGAITPNLVRCSIKRLAKKVGVKLPAGATVHAFRSGAAREFRKRGASLEEIRDLLRHSNIIMTRRYIGEDDDARRKIHRKYYPDSE